MCALAKWVFFLDKVVRTSQEAVQLHQELEVDIVAFGSLAMAAPNVVTIEIDT